MAAISRVFVGTIIHSFSPSKLEILERGALGVNDRGNIAFLLKDDNDWEYTKSKFNFEENIVTRLGKGKFIIPGFVDCHIHAPQYSFTGTGYDLPLLDWLNTYTFKAESKMQDIEVAKEVYSKVVKRTLRLGTTSASYFATIHLEASKLLVDIMHKYGQRGYVGKVNMDRTSTCPEYYVETTDQSLKDTEEFIKYTLSKQKERDAKDQRSIEVLPIITPRFSISCTMPLMTELGKLATKYDIPIQTHVSENPSETDFATSLEPCTNYCDIYNQAGLLTEKTILAHGVYLKDEELEVLKEKGTGIAHCPVSNFAIRSGVFHLRRAVQNGVKVGLGTDVSGGYSPSIIEAIRQAITASSVLHFQNQNQTPGLFDVLSFKEAFYYSTMGGAKVMGLQNKIGNFEANKSFDALVVDVNAPSSPFDNFDFTASSVEDLFQKFIFLGDDRNIQQIYVQGNLVELD